jgi:sigma-B regulation protein RsbU (phosphoserine phosphatase)
MISAARSVGGDLYDFFYLDEHHICFAVGDVSGKGVPASLFMMLTRTILRAKVKPSLSTGKIVTAMNKLLCENNEMSMFVSFFIGILNLQTGKLNYCNAGHNLPHLLRNDGRIETLPVRHGIPLGIIDQEPYFDDSFTLKEGDKILVYTDGVARGQNYLHEMFGEVKIQSVLKQLVHLSPRECVQHLHDEVMEFIGNTEQDDDIAILAIQYMGHEHGYKTMKLHNTATSS